MRPVKRNFAPVKRKNVTLLYIILYSAVPAKKNKTTAEHQKKYILNTSQKFLF
nr:MAG TPA: hypothetical protein [Herelleviridae sp.]